MLILTIRTDKPEAEIGLYKDNQQLAHEKWHAHRQLSVTIHAKIEQLLKNQRKDWHDIEGIVAFKGPGSFTGLRIGLTVANTLAEELKIPIVGTNGNGWQATGTTRLQTGKNEHHVTPEYGSPVHTTPPKK